VEFTGVSAGLDRKYYTWVKVDDIDTYIILQKCRIHYDRKNVYSIGPVGR